MSYYVSKAILFTIAHQFYIYSERETDTGEFNESKRWRKSSAIKNSLIISKGVSITNWAIVIWKVGDERLGIYFENRERDKGRLNKSS